MNITVIGATGRLGQRVVEEAARRGHQVTGRARYPQRLARPDSCFHASPQATAVDATAPTTPSTSAATAKPDL
jgi:uncharacterized protein YbjT (DUF2867 family)